MSNVYFFGCIGGAGHHFFNASIKTIRPVGPWSYGDLDPSSTNDASGRIPAFDAWMYDDHQKEGEAVLSYRKGWTRLGWADRSIDSRRGSHANILAQGIHTADEMLALGRSAFGQHVFSRIRYEIVLRRTVGDGSEIVGATP